MHVSPQAQLALILHVPFTIVLFSIWRVEKATAVSLLTAALFLPERIVFDAPGMPPLGKHTLPTLVCFILIATKKGQGGRKSSLFFPLVIVWLVIGRIFTVFTNPDPVSLGGGLVAPGLVIRDIVSYVSTMLFSTALPFAIGRRVFRTRQNVDVLLRWMVGFGVFYAFLMLVEIRMSPMLNVWIYGYHQHDWVQSIRAGGYRPVVFTAHGLTTAMYCLCAVLGAVTLARVREKLLNVPVRYLAAFLAIVLAVSNSMGAVVYAAVVVPLLWSGSPKSVARFSTLIAILVISIPFLRFTGLFPVDDLVETFGRISEERAASLKFRFDQENTLLAKWAERPFFGWGGYGRCFLFDEYGKEQTVVDGAWIGVLSHFGLFGFFGEFLLLVVPIWVARKNILRLKAPALRYLFAGLVLILAICSLDLIPNGLSSILPVLFAGSLFGFSESLSDPHMRAAEEEEARRLYPHLKASS